MSAQESCLSLIKYFLFVFNLFFFVLGSLIFCFGIWILIDKTSFVSFAWPSCLCRSGPKSWPSQESSPWASPSWVVWGPSRSSAASWACILGCCCSCLPHRSPWESSSPLSGPSWSEACGTS
ncbi:CD37 molecule [Homo sapiens]|uniref:CD37 molecule n=1 Tax=Homo sapiens TaxID=9606 RepID=M0R1J1_HUMAN|nr:CD37 molecule [Homo sapiens]KAI4043887.1 CD37 molecule [Homo sapiens]